LVEARGSRAAPGKAANERRRVSRKRTPINALGVPGAGKKQSGLLVMQPRNGRC
jgi:hypothetical protein